MISGVEVSEGCFVAPGTIDPEYDDIRELPEKSWSPIKMGRLKAFSAFWSLIPVFLDQILTETSKYKSLHYFLLFICNKQFYIKKKVS